MHTYINTQIGYIHIGYIYTTQKRNGYIAHIVPESTQKNARIELTTLNQS